jgi:phospholipid-binding lipoprotein MlaA
MACVRALHWLRLRTIMSRYFPIAGLCVCWSVLCFGTAVAAPSDAVAPNDPAPTMPTQTLFVDLTKGDAPIAMPERVYTTVTNPRVRHIDLSNGAPLPAAVEDEPPPPPTQLDTITINADRLNDPYEDANRGRFKNHVRLHRYVIDPVERAYIYVVPTPARDGLHNFLTNLETPAVLANDLFQGDLDRAGNTLSRFVVNTTIGIGGVFDFAGRAGLAYRDNDFGATLANYGVSDYPYLLIPIIGPSNPRDLSGKVVDYVLDPLHFVTLPGGIITSISHAGLHQLDKRSVDVGELDMLDKTSPDAYAEERAKAREERNAEITGTPLPLDSRY